MKTLLLAILVSLSLSLIPGCYMDDVGAEETTPSVVYYNGGYGYYYHCENNYSQQCWYPAPQGYVYGRPIFWGPHYYHPYYPRPPYRVMPPPYRGGYGGGYRGGYGGRGGWHGGHR
jgi:hypothetical protein